MLLLIEEAIIMYFWVKKPSAPLVVPLQFRALFLSAIWLVKRQKQVCYLRVGTFELFFKHQRDLY